MNSTEIRQEMIPDLISLAIIMINYKTPHLVIDAVASLIPELVDINARIIVVDNQSGDDSVPVIRNWIEMHACSNYVSLLEAPRNLGFSGGNNYGIKAVNADYYLLLNSDTIIRPGAISTLLNAAKKNQDFGMFSPRLEWPSGEPQESCFNFHRPGSEAIKSASTGVISRILSRYLVPQPVGETCSSPEWTSFACVLIRKRVFDDIGLMDDSFFMYYEDTEFCFRARRANWRIVNNPEARVVHLRGGSSNVKKNSKLRKRLPKYYYESRTKYYYKCYGRSGLLLANIFWMMGRSIAFFRELIGNKKPHSCEMEWLDIWTNFMTPGRLSVMYKDEDNNA